MDDALVEKVRGVLRQHIQVDASGLTPAVVSHYVVGLDDAARAAIQAVQEAQWRPIETAPRDGTRVDLYDGERRWTDCYWGVPDHCCGEAGRHCDSDWHSLEPGWVDGTFNEMLGDETSAEITHWMPLPSFPKEGDNG